MLSLTARRFNGEAPASFDSRHEVCVLGLPGRADAVEELAVEHEASRRDLHRQRSRVLHLLGRRPT